MKKIIAILIIFLSCLSVRGVTNLNAWCRNGQIWLVWDESIPELFAYDVYVSKMPITNLTQAELTGRIFPEDCKAQRLKEKFNSSATWTVPDENSNSYTLSSTERLFVFTPQLETNYYFAVVDFNETNVTPESTTGPIHSFLENVQCHVQAEGVLTSGYPFTIYAHFVDGREDNNSGLSNYPVMANQYANGIRQNI